MKLYIATVCGTDEEAGVWQEVVGACKSEDKAISLMQGRVDKIIKKNYELDKTASDYKRKGYRHYVSIDSGNEVEGQVMQLEVGEE